MAAIGTELGLAAGRYRPEQIRPAPMRQGTAAADAFAVTGPCALVVVPLHDGLLLLRTGGACLGDQRTQPFIPGARPFSFTPM
jgi:hypothetical protein